VSYVAAVVVNAVRIVFALSLRSVDLAAGWWTDARIHRLEGIAVYFGGLLVLHFAVRSLARVRASAARPA
jgi:hypothetical protein